MEEVRRATGGGNVELIADCRLRIAYEKLAGLGF
jgi:hypothetical protein